MNYFEGRKVLSDLSAHTFFRHAAAEFSVLKTKSRCDNIAVNSSKHRLIAFLESSRTLHRIAIDGLETIRRNPIVGDMIFVPAFYDLSIDFAGRPLTLACLEFPRSKVILESPDIAPLAFFRDTYAFEAMRAMATRLNVQGKVDLSFLEPQLQALQAYLAVKLRGEFGGAFAGAGNAHLTGSQLAGLLSRMDEGLHQRMSVPELAGELGMSARAFCRAFYSAVGKTPTQYVLFARVSRARDLLRDTNMDITSIALSVGFSSHAHLTRTFKRYFGTSPRDIRRQVSR